MGEGKVFELLESWDSEKELKVKFPIFEDYLYSFINSNWFEWFNKSKLKKLFHLKINIYQLKDINILSSALKLIHSSCSIFK